MENVKASNLSGKHKQVIPLEGDEDNTYPDDSISSSSESEESDEE